MFDLDIWHVCCTRQQIIHERRSYELPIFIVYQLFQHCRADSLRDASTHLSFNDHRVNHLTAIFNGKDFLDLNDAGFYIDFHDCGMPPIGKDIVCRIKGCSCFQRWVEIFWMRRFGKIDSTGDLRH